MDLSRVGSPFENGLVVKIDPGDYWRNYCAKDGEKFRNEGVVGSVVGRKAHRLHEGETDEMVPDDQKSVVIIRTMDDRIIEEHWSYVRRVTPLEALAYCSE